MVWDELDEVTRAALDNKLDALYGYERSAAAFESIPVEKQQALLKIMRRLAALNLWSAVRRIDNLYGEGGVGMYFMAWPFLGSTLRRRRDFTRWFARHRDNSGGFLEKTQPMASLHFLYIDNGQTMECPLRSPQWRLFAFECGAASGSREVPSSPA